MIGVVVEFVEAGKPHSGGIAQSQCLVGQYLGGAHQHGGVAVDGGVTDGQTHLIGTQEFGQLEELLPYQRLDGRRPHGPLTPIEGQQNARHRHQALAGPGGCGQHHMGF